MAKKKRHVVRGPRSSIERLAFELCIENARKTFTAKPERARPYVNHAWYMMFHESDRERYRTQARAIFQIMKDMGWKPPKNKATKKGEAK